MLFQSGKRFAPFLCAILAACALSPSALAAGVPKATTGTNQQTAMYGIGSTSKVFVSAAVLRLAEEGKLDLDLPLVQYLPEFTMRDPRYVSITPRMLLNHSSGLPGACYQNTMLLGDNDTFTHDTLLEQLSRQRLKDDPGSFSVYCNDGFTLAELLVERVSGMDFTQYLEKNFFRPIGIERIKSPQSDFDRKALAPVYFENRDSTRLPYESANVIGSGGLYATAEDLCRFASIFTRGGSSPVLSPASVQEMENPSFAGGVWDESDVPSEGSALAYGLGWDSVNTYPFGKYGIKALSKGGDTATYHGALTVLPEENISCAVLSSGGSSGLNNMAVQEILLEYLRETGRIPLESSAEEPAEPAAVPIPDGLQRFEGWYISNQQAIQVDLDGNDALILSSSGTARDTSQRYLHIGDGVFCSTEGAYISPEGKLVKTEGGTKGTTKLSFQVDSGTSYLMTETVESMPGMGESRYNVPFAQSAEAVTLEAGVAERWAERTKKRYYLVSEKYTSTVYLKEPSLALKLIDGLPGYICTGDSGPGMLLDQITDENNARFIQRIPAQAGRDLSDLRAVGENGSEYLETQSFRFISEEGIPNLGEMQSVVIGPDGDTKWHSVQAGGAENYVITAPENGNFFVYALEKDGLTITSSSLTGQNSTAIHLPAECRIAFAGEPGAVFSIKHVLEESR